ncbi:hypothetical protein [Gordonia sp. UCD-TK1]|uniref:hypothetical protein n=1 Tax=Gordonia sp. UCD-TK1 TaxID=1857893 RepID=UPI00080EC33A|nr:hypothetical protein [Gordonia sp. UCD-TK1]OCH83026.1 hypothetical protein A9310_01920 [Gordonia sp. UCD-TK1]
MSVPARRSRPAELAAGLSMAAMMMLAIGACSSDDAEPAPSPESAVSTSAAETSSPATSADTSRASASPSRGSEAGSDTGSGSTMTCTEFRELDDARRAAVLTDLDVTDNVQQVATVAATVCLTRPDDTIAAVVAELLPR